MIDCCECYLDDGEPIQFPTIRKVKARRVWTCVECEGEIKPGQTYELIRGKWQDVWDETRTCQTCLNIRKTLCPCAPVGTLWENLLISLELRLEDIPDAVAKKLDEDRWFAGTLWKGTHDFVKKNITNKR